MTLVTQDLASPRPRDALGAFGVYVHVPFCSHRCWYCDFNAYAGLDDAIPAYMDALVTDVRGALSAPEDLCPRPEVTSIFFGGGTPSLVEAGSLTAVLDAIRDSWPVRTGAEITVECNPESAAPPKLEAYLEAGVTRLSFGVQSLDDGLLASLGRVHDAATALRALGAAHAAGFEDVNADLIFAIPGETDADWRASLERVVEAGVCHISCYGLTYEEGTPMNAWRRLGKVVPVPDDDAARRWEIAGDVLGAAGLERYEISNWARAGRRCAHNDLYWACGEYIGIGAGAHSHTASGRASVRSWTVRSPDAYARAVARGDRPVAGRETVSARGREAEVMFLGLRRTQGVSEERFRSLTGRGLSEVYGGVLDALAGRGLVAWDGTTAALTPRGTLLANEVVAEFLDVPDDGDD